MSCNHDELKDSRCFSCGVKYEMCTDGKMRRTTLPATVHERRSHENAFMSFLRRLIGMELTRAGFPINFFEPATWLQRQAELCEYIDKLRHITEIEPPVERMAGVVGVFMSMISMLVNCDRVMVINPILGETFELCRPDHGYRIVVEQVVHHPPNMAFYLESVNMKGEPDGVYRAWGQAMGKATFWGTTLEIYPKGFYTIELLHRGEAYTLKTDDIKIIVSNLLRGIERFKLRFDNECSVIKTLIKKDASLELNEDQLQATIKYHGPCDGTNLLGGWDEAVDPAWADGYIENSKGEKLMCFYGKYNFEFYSVPTAVWESSGGWKKALAAKKQHKHKKPHNVGTKTDYSLVTGLSAQGASLYDFSLPKQKLLWRKEPLPALCLDYFRMSKYAMQMNDLANTHSNLPPTDSRLRQDLRALEQGDLDTAGKEKFIIEEKQRADLRQRLALAGKKSGSPDPWKPIWFQLQKHPYLEAISEAWIYTGEYYKRDWSVCPDLGFQRHDASK